MILLISGKMGSGKTTLAKNIGNEWQKIPNHRAIFLNFAGPLYDMHDFIIGYLKDHGITRDLVKDGALLQVLGTDWGRKTVSENLWVDLLKAKIAKAEHYSRALWQNQLFIVGDCRFRNEFDAFPEALKVRLSCNRDIRKARCEQWRENENHLSETDLDSYVEQNKFDLVCHTDSVTMNEQAVCESVMLKLKERMT